MNGSDSRVERIRQLLEQNIRLLPCGGGTKSALSQPVRDEQIVETTVFSGMVEYIPEEFTFTAFAGTRLSEIDQVLSQHGQYLPFDPPLVERGATLGGTVAAGLSGSGRHRYGGIRDFILGVRFIDGRGELITAGGKVVKNVAGFDFPRLMVGSLGALGIMVELSFKVFPKPASFSTWHRSVPSLDEALQIMKKAFSSKIPLDAMDVEVQQDGYSLWLRIGGTAAIQSTRVERIMQIIGPGEVWEGAEEVRFWSQVKEFAWVPEGFSVVKIALTPISIPALEAFIDRKPYLRWYASGGQMAWIAMDDSPRTLIPTLERLGLTGLVIIGKPGFPHLGEIRGKHFLRKVKDILDPAYRFGEV